MIQRDTATTTPAFGFTAVGMEYASMPRDIRERFTNMEYVNPRHWTLNQQIMVLVRRDSFLTDFIKMDLTEIHEFALDSDSTRRIADPIITISVAMCLN